MAYTDASTVLDRLQPGDIFRNLGATLAKNLDNAHGSIERVFCEHDLRLAHSGERLKFTHRTAGLNALTFNLISYGADVEVNVNDKARSLYIMVIPLSGEAEVLHGNEQADINRGSYIILDPDQAFRFRMDAAHSHLAVGIPQMALNKLMQSADIPDFGSKFKFSHMTQDVTEGDHGLFDFLGFLCREVDRPKSNLQALATHESLQDSFLKMLLSSTIGSDEAARQLSQAGIVPNSIRLAEKFMRENIKEDILAEDVARAAGVSPRALSYSFRMFRNTSPMQWLKRQRLYRAREDLIKSNGESSVTEVALRYCASNPGRFANAYFCEFGEYPSQTLKKKLLTHSN